MAATRLIALHINKGKTVAQCLADRTDYTENAAKTEDGKYISAYACDAKTCDEEFLLSKRQYEHITGRTQAHDVIAYQIRQSFKPGEITPEEANEIGKTELVVNRLRADMVKRGDMMSSDDVVEILAVDLLGVVPDDENIVVSTNQGEPLVGNKSLAGQAYENICHRIMGEDVPLLDLYQKNGLFSKIKNKFKS